MKAHNGVLQIATLFTNPMEEDSPRDHVNHPVGIFTLPIKIAEKAFLQSPAKKDFVKSTISAHLASAIMDTEVPIEYWNVELHIEIAKEFNLPQAFSCDPLRRKK